VRTSNLPTFTFDPFNPPTIDGSYYCLPSEVVAIRIYNEDTSDEWRVCVDGIAADGTYSEAFARFTTLADATSAVPAFCADFGIVKENPE